MNGVQLKKKTFVKEKLEKIREVWKKCWSASELDKVREERVIGNGSVYQALMEI